MAGSLETRSLCIAKRAYALVRMHLASHFQFDNRSICTWCNTQRDPCLCREELVPPKVFDFSWRFQKKELLAVVNFSRNIF